jgi:hypothetical protein
MKKKLLFLVSLITIVSLTIYISRTNENDLLLIKEQHANNIKNHPFSKTSTLTKKERKAKGMPPNQYFEQEYLLEMNPFTGKTHPENVLKIQQELNALRKLQRVPGDASDNKWVERGPNNVGGRTRVVMFDPNDVTNKRVFAGGVSGGLWVNNDITNLTSSWTQVGIDENLAISCMAVDPNNSQIMYVGTGESYTGDDGVGNGVWKSTDGGASWTNVLRDDFNVDKAKRINYVNDIVAWNNPGTGKTEVLVAVARAYYGEGGTYLGDHGLWKSSNDGVSWTELNVEISSGSNYIINDFEVGPDNTIWAATTRNTFGDGGGTILKSTNGDSFSVAHTVANADRTEIAVSKTNKDVIYVLASRYRAGLDPLFQKTTNGFVSATAFTGPQDADTGIPNTDFTRGQQWYDLVIEVDPIDDTKIYAGGIDLFRSTDSGTNWKQISKWSNNNNLAGLNIPLVHADQHGWAFHPTDPDKAVIGNDGGVYYASSLLGAETTTTAIAARNRDYNVTQFYHGEIGQNASFEILLAGAQDNGTQFVENAAAGVNGTQDVYGGDGAYSFVDKDGEYIIVSYVRNTKARLNLSNVNTGITLDSDSDTGSFINPGDLDDNLDILYSNASHRQGTFDSIIRYSGIKSGEVLVKKRLGNPLLNGSATAFRVSPFTTTSTKLFIGTVSGRVLKVENADTASPTWSAVSPLNWLGSVSSVSFGANEDEIIVTMHNYGVNNIWYTSNGGTSWSMKDGNFPDIPVKAAIMNPVNNDEVMIGTQLGVWRTSNFKDASPSWTQSFDGMSNVKVTSFSLRTSDNTVLATTYGRGMFSGQFATGVASVDDVLKDNKVFTMYPTVSDGSFTVFAKNTLGKTNLKMFDINGRLVHNQQIDFTQQEKQPVQVNLNAGVYIVNLIDSNNKKATSKVIIK